MNEAPLYSRVPAPGLRTRARSPPGRVCILVGRALQTSKVNQERWACRCRHRLSALQSNHAHAKMPPPYARRKALGIGLWDPLEVGAVSCRRGNPAHPSSSIRKPENPVGRCFLKNKKTEENPFGPISLTLRKRRGEIRCGFLRSVFL